MQLGMIGLGRMGASMVQRLMRAAMNAWSMTCTQKLLRDSWIKARAERLRLKIWSPA